MSQIASKSFTVVVPAAGVGSRMQASVPKQYLTLLDKTILEHTVERLLSHPRIEQVVVAVSDTDPYFTESPLAQHSQVVRVSGGKERADSVLSGLSYLAENSDNSDWILVHDAARPCVQLADIDALIEGATSHPVGGILAAPVRDTMKRTNEKVQISQTVDRNNLWHALTPQMFKLQPLKEALEQALEQGVAITDEASALEWKGEQPQIVAGRSDNLKVTQPEDLALAEFYLTRSKQQG
ncbi:2-C-methyl-D-erythritol 4-phosphate cytidylyltransferase [Vibrio sp. SCSIO 43136]|uniref:2-C-methyl-D-erythritol 4-phosphate cytidylyltransferase n=1 Tax=Vibrio sp. SCSIO 43136 TaxID=2819101 RepID=UPI002075B8C0|nr:2-C-methyl-D-erythritol 4-phosphate cytidylyltransferase [Vibrio sp. SCSIO 43136]USD65671.1 2-C-methyl-D-erythritol 4-phosphate cytidylyltransferase [Vibrio sp. SCSIO 43136]